MVTRKWILVLGAAALLWPASVQAQSPDQQAMAQKIATGIRESGKLTNYRVGVKYQDGVAWLLGSVTDPSQEQMAIELANQMDGVEHVISKLEVGSGQPQKAATPAKTDAEETSTGVLLQLLDESPAEQEEEQAGKTVAYEPKPLKTTKRAKPAPSRLALRNQPARQTARRGMPQPFARTTPGPMPQAGQRGVQPAQYGAVQQAAPQGYVPAGGRGGAQGVSYDSPNMPGYAWPSYAAHPNYSAVTYPKQYSPTAWPYIGPFYPYPQVPLGWRKVALEWDDGWWFLDFSHHQRH
ncbi:MAG: BON domain-containing protein [Planctomycetota bacterium]